MLLVKSINIHRKFQFSSPQHTSFWQVEGDRNNLHLHLGFHRFHPNSSDLFHTESTLLDALSCDAKFEKNCQRWLNKKIWNAPWIIISFISLEHKFWKFIGCLTEWSRWWNSNPLGNSRVASMLTADNVNLRFWRGKIDRISR